MAIVGVLWTVCGYSLTFGSNILGGFVGWNDDYFFLKGIDDTITDGVPEYVLAMFQGKFAIIAPRLDQWSAGRARIIPWLLLIRRTLDATGLQSLVPLGLGIGWVARQCGSLRCY